MDEHPAVRGVLVVRDTGPGQGDSGGGQALHQLLVQRLDDRPRRAASYLEAKEPYLVYHIALALGWPIATGVIEGSCRHLVKDRLDLAGRDGAWPAPRPSCSCEP